MPILINILTVFEVIVCILLSLLVLMQRPRQEGLGAAFGSGMTDQMFGAQTTNVLQRGSVYLGVALFVLTFLLAILTSHQDKGDGNGKSLLDPKDKKVVPSIPKEPKAEEKPVAIPAPATTTPADTKPADTKPAETKPADAKPADTTSAPAPETKPVETPAAPAGTLPVPDSAPTPPPAPAPEPPK